jgi:hypothetical protein
MKYEFTEKEVEIDVFGWTTLFVYDFWIKGKTLTEIKTTLLEQTARKHSKDSDFYTHTERYIENTYNLLVEDNEKCVNAAKVMCCYLAIITAKKVVNTRDFKQTQKLKHTLSELQRIGTKLGVFSESTSSSYTKDDVQANDQLLIDEIKRHEDKISDENELSAESCSKLMKVTERVILHRQKADRQGAKNTLILWVIIIGVIIVISSS